jgi:ABC-2 type transport system permease protein
MRVALVIAGKELRQRLRDRTAIVMAFVAPTLIAAIVTGAFGSGFGPGRLYDGAAVADLDHSPLSRAFYEVLGSRELRSIVAPRKVTTARAARELVARNDVSYAFVIPAGFGRRVTAGQDARLEVIRDARYPISGDVAEAIASGFTQQLAATQLSIYTAARRTGSAPDTDLIAAATRSRIPVRLLDKPAAPKCGTTCGASYFAPAMAIFFLFFTVGPGARSLIAEREQGTMARLLAAPAARGSIIVGKALAMFVLGLMSMISVYVFTSVLFHVNWGDPLSIAVLSVLIVVAVMSVTALVQTFARTEQQAAAYGSLIGPLFTLAGGSFFPLFQLPAFMRRLSALTPNGWAMRGFTDIAYDGVRLAHLVPNILAISAFIAVCGVFAATRVRRIVMA